MHVRSILSGRFKSYSVSQRVQLIAAAIPTSNRHRTVRTAASWLVPIAVVLSTLISAEPWLSAQAPQSLRPNQVATFSLHPSSSGTVTVTLPQIIQQHATIIVGVTFSPADITGVTIGEVGGGPADVESLTRGLATSILHDGPGGALLYKLLLGYQSRSPTRRSWRRHSHLEFQRRRHLCLDRRS